MTPEWEEPIIDDIRTVESEMLRNVKSRHPLLNEIAMEAVSVGGKRIRPGVSLLAFHCVGGEDKDRIMKLAVALELIHSATLVHDDINDKAEMRRGKTAIYKKYGLERAIITGDFLFVQGFKLGGYMESEEIIGFVASACSNMAESEFLQIDEEHDISTPLETYLNIIGGKTAGAIEASARLGAYIGGGSPEEINSLGEYGRNMGYAFQIIDDILDITGNEADMGKPVGMDIKDGRPNLPVMIAMNLGNEFISKIFKEKSPSDEEIKEAVKLVKDSGAFDVARNHAQDFYNKALESIENIASSVYKDSLISLADTIMTRRS